MKESSNSSEDLYKVMILYPNSDTLKFDMTYYKTYHMPMMAKIIGSNLEHYEIDSAMTGMTKDEKPPFRAIGYFYIKDVEAYNKAIIANLDSIGADLKKYTNIQPLAQTSKANYYDGN